MWGCGGWDRGASKCNGAAYLCSRIWPRAVHPRSTLAVEDDAVVVDDGQDGEAVADTDEHASRVEGAHDVKHADHRRPVGQMRGGGRSKARCCMVQGAGLCGEANRCGGCSVQDSWTSSTPRSRPLSRPWVGVYMMVNPDPCKIIKYLPYIIYHKKGLSECIEPNTEPVHP